MKELSGLTTQQLRARYLAAAEQHGQATRAGDAQAANRAHETLTSVAPELQRRGAEGLAVLQGFLADPDPAVRVWAAVAVLTLAPAEAEQALEEVASGSPSPHRLNAEMVLREWRAGRLSRLA